MNNTEIGYRMPFGDALRWIAGAAETNGAYAVLERTAPPGARAPGHQHRRSEAFYVLDGELMFTIGGKETHAAHGSFLIAPEKVAHGWTVTSDVDARLLLIFAPAPDRAYFAEIDRIVREAASPGEMDGAALTHAFTKYGWA